MATITTLDALKASAQQFQKELLVMPVTTAATTLQHMTGIPSLLGDYTLGQIEGAAELAPYKTSNVKDGAFTIKPRTLKLQLGNCALQFDPNEVWGTIYGSLLTQGEDLKAVSVAQNILFYVAGVLGKKLNGAIFAGKRADDGTTTKDLFDGFDTITTAEITAKNITAEKGNYADVPAITEANAVDTLMDIYAATSDELQDQEVNIYLSRDIYNKYCRNYQTLHGALPYNQEFSKTFLDGSNNQATFVPLASKKGSQFIHIAPRENMVYGYGAGSNPSEALNVEKYEPWKLTLEACMAFGVQFRSISPEMLFVAKVAGE